MKLFFISIIFSLLSLHANFNFLQTKSLKGYEEKTNQNYLIDGVEVHDSSELVTTNFQSQKLVIENEGSEYNIVSKNLNTGVLNFIDFDEEYYYYRQYAFDTAETKSNLRKLKKTNDVQESNIQVISNNIGESFLYTEGYTPDYESSNQAVKSSTRVIGNDDRSPVENTTEWPYRATGYLSIRYDVLNNETGKIDSRYYMGTGFLEGPDLMVTAGHCTYGDVTASYNDSNGIIHTEYEDYLNNPRFPDQIIFYPAQNGASFRPYDGVKVERVYLEKSYYTDTLKDWACCKLESPIGYETGWYGKIANFYQKDYPFYSFGYPGSKNGRMFTANAKFTDFEAENGWYYRTNLDAEGGQSGSPYRVNINGSEFMCGIHTYGVGNSYSGGTRIDGFMFAFLNSFVYGNYEYSEIVPTDYGFEDAYPVDEVTKNEYTNHNVGDLNFKTRRYRTGYIHNEYVVMSPIKTGITEAFIEYRFTEPVKRIDVELSHWREYTYEWLNSSTGKAELQTIDLMTGNWIEEIDLLEDISLPTDRTQPKTYTIVFNNPIYRFRFYSKVNNPQTSSSNRGRICIGKMEIWQSKNYDYLPLSGSELLYDTSLWNGDVEDNNNCYNYAINNQVIPGTNVLYDKQQPGQYAGVSCYPFTKENLVSAVQADFAKYNADYGTNLVFEEIGRYEKCPEGTYKVALVAYSGDYHWYRQEADGYWSHKRGHSPVERIDYSGNLIIDPYTANRGNYTNFIGYFAVSPWGNMYVQ